MEDGKLMIDNKECTRCMHCINVMPRALRPGTDTGVSILLGAKAPILEGAQMGVLTIPFMKCVPPYDSIKENVIEPIWDWWMEEGKNRERLGELIQRQGIKKLLEVERYRRLSKQTRKIDTEQEEITWHYLKKDWDYLIRTNQWKTGLRTSGQGTSGSISLPLSRIIMANGNIMKSWSLVFWFMSQKPEIKYLPSDAVDPGL
jgi:hypothetical protein